MILKRFAVVFERGPASVGAYVPDLPGCVAVAESVEEVDRLIRDAIVFHIERLRETGGPVPEPSSSVEYVDIAF